MTSLLLLAASLSGAASSAAQIDPDSYAVYSEMMNSQTRGKSNAGLWMISAATTSYDATQPCKPDLKDDFASVAAPQRAIHVPPEDRARFQEVLDNFEAHCHDGGVLQRDQFKTDWPIRLLTSAESKRFEIDLAVEDPKLWQKWPKGATGLQSFSQVFFNHDHTLAMAYSSYYCGMLCATWEWQVLERTETGWKVLPWKHDTIVS